MQHREVKIADPFNILKNVPEDGILEINNNNQIVSANQAMEQILKKPEKELIGRPFQEVIPNLELKKILSKVLMTGQMQAGQKIKVETANYICHCVPIKNGRQIKGALAIFTNITDLLQIQEELRKTKDAAELLETVLDNAYNGIIVVDKNARITIFNKAYCDFLEVKKEDMIGRPVEEAIENTRMQVSRMGEFHPQALSEPDWNLSAHPAPIIQQPCQAVLCSKAPPLRLATEQIQDDACRPLRSAPITRLHHYYGLLRPYPPHRYFRPCGSSA